jgi:NitT/TauT family transport system permease protein
MDREGGFSTMKSASIGKLLLPLFSGMVFVGIWYGLIALFAINPYFLPPFHEVIAAFINEGPRLLESSLVTASFGITGFVIAVIVGISISLGLSSSRTIRQAVYPWVLLIQMTPVVIFAPVIVLWFDYGAASVVTITFITSFFPIVANTTLGLVSTDPNLIDCFKVYRASRLQELFLLRLPNALPNIINGIKIAATLVPIGAVFGEFFVGSFEGGRGGLGLLVFIYNKETRIPELFAAGLSACLLGLIIVTSIQFLNWLLLHKWHDSFSSHNRS